MMQTLVVRRGAPAYIIPGVLIGLLALLAVLFVLAVGLGSTAIPPGNVIAALFGAGSETDRLIIMQLRLPRILLALQAGACLAVAGALLQTAARNPLASPTILGIVDGAALGVLVFLFAFSDDANALTVSIHYQPLAAGLGALVFALAVAVLTWRDPRGTARMILYGVALGALASALVTILMIVGPVYRTAQALTWLAGSVHAAHWDDVTIVGAIMLATVPVLALLPRAMNQMVLDSHSAHATGLAVTGTFLALMALSVFLTATAVSFVGGVAFVGLIAPHAARLLVGHRAIPMLIASALLGAGIVVAADIIGRVLFAPLEVPTGAITAMVGAPYFIWLLIMRSRTHA